MTRLRSAVVVHYREISLKRGNRPLFLRHLARNLARATADLGPVAVRQLPGRIVVDLDGHPDPEGVERGDGLPGFGPDFILDRDGTLDLAVNDDVKHRPTLSIPVGRDGHGLKG